MTKSTSLKEDLKKATSRLEEVLSVEKTEITRDSAIKRFEIAMDLTWKTIKAVLEEEKAVITKSPVSSFKEAYKQGLIDNDGNWIEFIKMRNETAHIYKEEMANEVYKKLPEVLKSLQSLQATLSLSAS